MTRVTILMGRICPFLLHPLFPPPLPHLQKQLHVQGEQIIQVPKSEVRSVPQSLRDSVKIHVPWPTLRDPDAIDLTWGLESYIFNNCYYEKGNINSKGILKEKLSKS